MGVVDLLLLTDGRAPIGAYAHSYGLEDAVAAGDVDDVAALAAFVDVRVRTSGLVEAAFTAAVHRHACSVASGSTSVELMGWAAQAEEEYTARVLSPALRDVSRQLGRYLLRLGRRAWPDPRLDALAARPLPGWHQPVVTGAVCAVAGVTRQEAATVAVYGLASGIASAGVRLLGLDPIEVHAVQVRLGPRLLATAATAAELAEEPLARLPATGTPLLDIRAQHHAHDPAGRLFAS